MKRQIAEQMLKDKWNEFLKDVNEMESEEGYKAKTFAEKWGYYLTDDFRKKHGKNSKANLKWFLSSIWNGMWWEDWKSLGFERDDIFQLYEDGTLSHKEYTSSRRSRRGIFIYFNQKSATKIIFG